MAGQVSAGAREAGRESTAVLFAAPLKYWHRATIIGETTAEPLTFFGDNYEFDAPRTMLVTDVSHTLFQLLGSHGPQAGRGCRSPITLR
jgi:hypothetical protein